MDWNKTSGISGIGTFILTAIMLFVMVLPLVRQPSEATPKPASTPNSAPVQEHQPMNPWLMPSILAASLLISSYLHYRAAQLQRPGIPKLNVELSVPQTQTISVASPEVETERVIIDVGVEYFRNIFQQHMAIQSEKLIQEFIGKWMKISGKIENVKDHQAWTIVNFQGKLAGFEAFMFFDQGRWRGRLSIMQRGTEITVLGKIKEINGLWIALRDCELL